MQSLQIETLFDLLLLALVEARLHPEPEALMSGSGRRSAPMEILPRHCESTWGAIRHNAINAAALTLAPRCR